MNRLRLAFMGTPDFAVPALRALIEAGHDVAAVYTQPPRPAGRGQALRVSPVHDEAARHGIAVHTPRRLRGDPDALVGFQALRLDAAVVAAYGLILPREWLEAPRLGCLNIHASLLPRWRGAAPIQAAILAGDTQSGVCIMQMEEGLDSGPVLARTALAIDGHTTGRSLHDALSPAGADLLVRTLAEPLVPVPQPAEGITYAPKLGREDGRLDWSHSAAALDRRVRAMDPWPGAFTMLDGQLLKILAACPEPDQEVGVPAGTVLDERLAVATGGGILRIERLQLPGRAPLAADAFLRGRPIHAGQRLG